MANDGERLALLDEIEHLERALETHPSWTAWRALDSRIGLGRGPELKTIGALVGGFAMELAREPDFVALLAARDRLRRLNRAEGGHGTNDPPPREVHMATAAAVPLRPAPPFGQSPSPDQVIDAEFAEAAEPGANRSPASLMDRISSLEQETTTLVQTVSPTLRGLDPPTARIPVIEEAEVIIEEADELPANPSGGLVTRLDALTGPRSPSARPGSGPEVDEADVDIVIDGDEPRGPG